MLCWKRRANKRGIRQNYYGTIWYDDFYCKNTLIFFFNRKQQRYSFFFFVAFFCYVFHSTHSFCFDMLAALRRNALNISPLDSDLNEPNLNGHGSYSLLSKHHRDRYNLSESERDGKKRQEKRTHSRKRSPTSKTKKSCTATVSFLYIDV